MSNNKFKDLPIIDSNKFYLLAVKKGIKTTRKEVQEYIKSTETAQVHKQFKRNTENFRRIRPPKPIPGYWQMDMMDMTKLKRFNSGFGWGLMLIDIHSRYGVIYPSKSKKPKELATYLKKFIGNFPVITISSDNGNEFKGEVTKLLKENKIGQYLNKEQDKNTMAIVERWIRTIRDRISRKWI